MYASCFFVFIWSAFCLNRSSAQQFPSQDPFYTSPANVSKLHPGQVFRSRPIPKLEDSPVPISDGGGYQYVYRTTDSLGHPVAAVTTVLVPQNVSFPAKLLSYQVAYDSANIDCSPSYTLRAQANTSGTDRAFIAASLAQGWFVVTSDYEGLEAQYGAGVQAGQATLDSIRAVLNEGVHNSLSPATEVAIWGYSGGALASEWALELQDIYAPDLSANLIGAALGGLVPNITRLIVTIDGGTNAGLSFLGVKGLSVAYPKFAAYVKQHLIPSKKAEFESISSKCTIPAIVQAMNMSIFDYFDTGRGLITDPLPKSVLVKAGQMGLHGVPRLPVFAYKSEGDQYSPIGDTDGLVKQFCAQGASIEYHRDSVGNHNTQAITGGATAFEWIKKQFSADGTGYGARCTVQNVTLTSSSIAKAQDLGSDVITYLQNELGSEGVS